LDTSLDRKGRKIMFAPDCPREIDDETGHELILFPEDTKLRQGLFHTKVEHPSKNNLYIYDALYEYLMEPGQVVLDPMAGAGSCMWLARHGINVMLIELGDAFYELLQENRIGFEGNISIIHGDCRKILPFPPTIDHMVFSPPYANAIKVNEGMPMYEDEQRSIAEGIRNFVDNKPGNLSNMNDFYFNQAMRDIYKRLFASLKPDGTMTFILKDHYAAKKRVRVTEQHVRMAVWAGFDTFEWHKRRAVGSLFGFYNKQHGAGSVEEEDIVIMKKPL
jgi:hypothetical protein